MRNLGVQGFETILRGGIPARAEVLLLAPDGPERHLLGAHWILEGLSQGERALVLLSSEAPDAFLARLGRMGVDVPAALASGSLVVVDWFTCWTQAVEGVEESHRILRASRDPKDLLAAVERALPVLSPAPERRAYADFLPLALKALDGVQATEALGDLRAQLSEAGVTAIFVGDRALPEARLDALLQTFHAVLDARGEAREVLALAVLGVGGVKLTARYRRVRVREDGASVEAEAAVRTFSCPICDARVPFTAEKCPGCGTPRSEIPVRASRSGLMDYVDSLGRKEGVEPERGRVTRDRQGLTNGLRRAPGRVNGVAPGRVNGIAPTGRVNGIAPSGRVNGVAPTGRTNGLQGAGARTNGLVNGIRRARGGITNGLTNGSGFTNGLGGRRYRGEARASRWKLFLVPMIGAVLLVSPFLISEPVTPARFAVDGDFTDWTGVAGYAQDPDPDVNASVAITGYKVAVEGSTVYLYASVRGTWFASPNDVESLYVFVDADGDAARGYRVRGLGVDRLVVIEGSGGAVTSAALRSFPEDGDPDNWTAWQSAGSANAVSSGGELETSFRWDPEAGAPAILLMADDAGESRSYSAVAFGPDLGALRVTVRSRAAIVSRGTPDVLVVEMEAFGGPVTVVNLTWAVNDGVRGIRPPLPTTVLPDRPAPDEVVVQFDTQDAQPGDLLDARLVAVETEPRRPVLVAEDRVRAYVESRPPGKRVDGWFDDWTTEEFTDDVDGGARPPADLDLERFAANRTGDTLYVYADVRGQLLAGTPAPVRRAKPEPGGEPAPSAPAVPVRTVGEDILRVYVDADASASDGVPVLGLRGADYRIEIRGIHGLIVQRAAFQWRDGWQPVASPPAENDAQRLEASLPLADPGAVEVAYETSGWAGPEDVTEVSGTRGVRGGADGTFRFQGRFAATFSGGGRVALAARDLGFAWTLPAPGPAPVPWRMEATPIGVRYIGPDVEVRYTITHAGLKEEYIFARPPEGLTELSFPIQLTGGAIVWAEEGGSPAVFAGSRKAFEVAQPFAEDAAGVVTPLYIVTKIEGDRGRLGIPLPSALIVSARYPLVVDPVVNYTLEDDNPTTNDPGEQLGYSVAVGDFNGDGYADVLTGAPSNDRWTSPSAAHGLAYIWYGPFGANDTTPDVWINGTNLNATRFGWAVAAGRFNDDPYWDAVVARLSVYSPPSIQVIGNVSLYHGASGWSGEESTPDVEFLPPSAPKNFGAALAVANVDVAGFDDLIIGEPLRDNNGDGTADGIAYLYKSPFGAVEGSADYTLLPSSNAGGQFGRSLAAGKIDGDAYADVVSGEPQWNANQGRIQFFQGVNFVSGSGSRSPNATITAPPGGGNAGQFGLSLSVGRLNGDAHADVLVGSPFRSANAGAAYVYYANADGSGLTSGASASVSLPSQSSAEWFGYSVLIADFGDDGTNDAIVGAPQAQVDGTAKGKVYWFDDPASTDTTPDATVSGADAGERFGWSLAAGRFGSDPRTLLAIGAYLWDDGGEADSGRVVVGTVPEGLEFMLAAGTGLALLGRRFRRRSIRPRRYC